MVDSANSQGRQMTRGHGVFDRSCDFATRTTLHAGNTQVPKIYMSFVAASSIKYQSHHF